MGFKRSKVIGSSLSEVDERGNFRKKIDPPSNIVDKGGRTIPRCWRGRQGHGGMRSKLLAWVKVGQRATNSSVESVPV
jgi:hypothetical protein